VNPGRGWAGRFATRGMVLVGCGFGLMAVCWLLSGAHAHAATTRPAAVTSTTPTSSGGLLGAATGAVTSTVNGVASAVTQLTTPATPGASHASSSATTAGQAGSTTSAGSSTASGASHPASTAR